MADQLLRLKKVCKAYNIGQFIETNDVERILPISMPTKAIELLSVSVMACSLSLVVPVCTENLTR